MICGVVFVNTTFLVQRIFMEEHPEELIVFFEVFLDYFVFVSFSSLHAAGLLSRHVDAEHGTKLWPGWTTGPGAI